MIDILKELSRKIRHFLNGFGLENILGPMGSTEQIFVLVYLANCAQLTMLVMKTTCITNCKHFLKSVTSNLFKKNLK